MIFMVFMTKWCCRINVIEVVSYKMLIIPQPIFTSNNLQYSAFERISDMSSTIV